MHAEGAGRSHRVQIARLRLRLPLLLLLLLLTFERVAVAVAAVAEASAGRLFVGSSEEIGRESSVNVFATSLESPVEACMATYDSYCDRRILFRYGAGLGVIVSAACHGPVDDFGCVVCL
jgi:hypothetical protein